MPIILSYSKDTNRLSNVYVSNMANFVLKTAWFAIREAAARSKPKPRLPPNV